MVLLQPRDSIFECPGVNGHRFLFGSAFLGQQTTDNKPVVEPICYSIAHRRRHSRIEAIVAVRPGGSIWQISYNFYGNSRLSLPHHASPIAFGIIAAMDVDGQSQAYPLSRRERLLQFAKEGARTRPPVFVGRHTHLADICEAAGIVRTKWQEQGGGGKDHGMTRLLQAAPGAGKTALLRHLQEDIWGGRPGPENPIAIRLSASELNAPERMRSIIDEQLPRGLVSEAGGVVARILMGLATMGASDGSDLAKRGQQWAATRRAESPQGGAAIVVMVDEAQQVEPYSPEAKALQTLHQGHFGEAPVLAVFAGLGHLQEHLGQKGIGISRFSDDRRCIHTLQGLADADVDELLSGWLEHFEVSAGNDALKAWQANLRQDAQGWPMHVYNFLAATAESLTWPEIDDGALESADLQAVRRNASDRRIDDYGRRYQHPALKGAPARDRTGRLMARFIGGRRASDTEVLDWAMKEFGSGDHQQADAALAVFRERGFIQQAKAGRGAATEYFCPIPSLASCAVRDGVPLHLDASAGDLEAVEVALRERPGALAETDPMGRTVLHAAAEGRWADMVKALLGAGADPNAEDRLGSTPRSLWPTYAWPKALEPAGLVRT